MNPRIIAKIEAEEPSLHLAVLIDADNAQASVFEALLAEVARYGDATAKRIYGDFTSPTSSQWKKVLNKHAIKPVQQFAYTTGKNATDGALIIDAMDLLYTRRYGGFCIVSSDSDFTGLATRIREEGLVVYGFGEQKTPESFRNACNKFVFTEVLRDSSSPDLGAAGTSNTKVGKEAAPEVRSPAEALAVAPSRDFPRSFVLEALEKASDETGWAHLGTFGSYLTKLQPEFDSRLYGFKKLSDLVRRMKDVFQCEERLIPGSVSKELYIRAVPR